MHEHTFVQSIIKDIPDKENVIGLTLNLGELAGIEEEHLKSHLIDETGWDVNIKMISGKIKCPCGYEGIPIIKEKLHDLVIYECPYCGLIGAEIIEGGEIVIVKVIYK